MRRITQRELRNDNAEIVRGVEAGESYTITRRGVPVARLVPLSDVPDLGCDRPARTRPSYVSRARVTLTRPTEQLLDDLRGER